MTRSKAYEVLGLESSASIEAIKAAYAELSKKYHPEENPEEFQEIHEAYVTLTRSTRFHNRVFKNIHTRATIEERFIQDSILEKSNEEENFDFSNVDHAKQEEYERKLQNAIQELENMTYADKNYDIYVNNHRLKKFFHTQDAEVLYSEEIIEKLILLLQQTLVNGETVRIIREFIRPWDTGLEKKRESLNRLKKVLEERNRFYYKKRISIEDKDIIPYICWAIIGILLFISVITNFVLIIKCLVAFLLVGGILLFAYKLCRMKASEGVSAVISCFVVLGFMLAGYFCEIWVLFPEIPAAKALYEKFMELWIIVIAGTAFRMTKGK